MFLYFLLHIVSGHLRCLLHTCPSHCKRCQSIKVGKFIFFFINWNSNCERTGGLRQISIIKIYLFVSDSNPNMPWLFVLFVFHFLYLMNINVANWFAYRKSWISLRRKSIHEIFNFQFTVYVFLWKYNFKTINCNTKYTEHAENTKF